ncbi:MAG TPA: hypothetical protein VD908_00440 [Cytophagales bacterium]|nr:hypothetical protein [Cytophagales bacterium]
MKYLTYLILLIVFTSCSVLEKDIENTPADIEILFPKSGVTYYQGKFPDYIVFKIKDNEKNIKKIAVRSNGAVEYNVNDFTFDIYDDIPDTIFGISSVMHRYIQNEAAITLEAEETEEDGRIITSLETKFNLIPDSVIISDPVISNIEDLSPWDDMVNADIKFNIQTESGDLSTILAIRFTRFPSLTVYEPGHYFGGAYFFDNDLSSNEYSTQIQTSQTNSELYALVFVKSVIHGDEFKFYLFPVGKL